MSEGREELPTDTMSLLRNVPDANRARALGGTLTQMLDRKAALYALLPDAPIYAELHALDTLIYEALVTVLQSQIGSMVTLFDERLTALERRS